MEDERFGEGWTAISCSTRTSARPSRARALSHEFASDDWIAEIQRNSTTTTRAAADDAAPIGINVDAQLRNSRRSTQKDATWKDEADEKEEDAQRGTRPTTGRTFPPMARTTRATSRRRHHLCGRRGRMPRSTGSTWAQRSPSRSTTRPTTSRRRGRRRGSPVETCEAGRARPHRRRLDTPARCAGSQTDHVQSSSAWTCS